MRKFLKFLAVFGILLLIGLGCWSYHLSCLQDQVDAKIRELAQQGIPLTDSEMQERLDGKPITQNGADLFVKALRVYQSSTEFSEFEEILPIAGFGDLPNMDTPLPSEQLQAIQTYLDKNKQAMDLLRQAVLIPDFRYRIKAKGFATELPHLSEIRNAVELFILEAILATENNDPETAVTSLTTAVKLGKFLHNDPWLISHLVAYACYQMPSTSLQRLLIRCKLSDEQLQRLGVVYKIERTPQQFAQTYSAEIYSFWKVCNNVNLDGEVNERTFGLYKFSSIWHHDVLFYLNTMQKSKKACEKPYVEWIQNTPQQDKDKIEEKMPRHYILSALMLPALDSIWIKELEFVSHISNYQAVIAIERFRLKYGKLPTKLADVVPEFLDKEPIDVFVNKPIRYLPTAKGYVVYSVGMNQQDDNGDGERNQDGEIPDISFVLDPTIEKK